MNLIHKIGCLTLVVLFVFGFSSCKKTEEEETTNESMSGTIVFDVPYYVLKGETVTLSASGIIYPKDAQYKWYVSGVYTDSLTANTITVRFPDSLGVFLVSASSYANGFYSNVSSQQVTTIDTAWNTSLTGLERSNDWILDDRDGHVYHYVTVGDLDWFSQNLAWQGTGVPFKASPATADMFGSFYTWNEAMSEDVCPEGWYVPTQEDWESLATALNDGWPLPFVDNWAGIGEKLSADARLNDERLWPYSPDNIHTNAIGWNALPMGWTYSSTSEFSGTNAFGCWWSATEKNATQGYYRYIWYDRGDCPVSYTDKDDLRASVRCVRMHPQSL